MTMTTRTARAESITGDGPDRGSPLMTVDGLSVNYRTGGGPVKAVDRISFLIRPGESLGLVGESGCGKTTAAKSILRLLPPNAEISAGRVDFAGRDLVRLDPESLRRTRWKDISWISQAAMNALDPVYRVGDQIVEAIQAHEAVGHDAAWSRSEDLFREVGIDPRRLRAYPHEMSGGMKQRAVIAMALALSPKLIIADEPTTALDVVTQAQILSRLQKLRRERGLALLFITHDISVVVQTCDRVAVMYAGRIMETGPVREVFRTPFHPYTMGLTNAFPTLEGARRELISIPGTPPDLLNPPIGCRFAERCPFAEERCRREEPPLTAVAPSVSANGDASRGNGGDQRLAACHFPERAQEFRARSGDGDTWEAVAQRMGMVGSALDNVQTALPATAKRDEPVLSVDGLVKHFEVKQSFFRSLAGGGVRKVVHAVDGLAFDVKPGEILGLAGESGSGKTTTGEMLVRLQDPTDGSILFNGDAINALKGKALKAFRRQAQMVFQDPYETLNPRFTIGDIVAEPVGIHKLASGEALEARVVEALDRAGLRPPQSYLDRFPHELSGGQRQRVAIARAIVLEPKLIVADEPVSMLDVSIRAGVLNLLRRFRDELGISFVYVSHDLPTIRYVADRTAIMYLGEIVEIGDTETVIRERKHPYTQLLLDASPEPDPDVIKPPLESAGEIPSAIDPPNGCRFHSRCPSAMPHCGWEGRDVDVAISNARIAGTDLSPLGETRISDDNLTVTVEAPEGTRAARESLQSAMERKHPALRAAATIEDAGEKRITLTFEKQPSPKPIDLGDGHKAACLLYSR